MSPIQVMVISGLVTALAATTTLISGATFKRAFDQWHHSRTAESASPKDEEHLVAQTPVPSETTAVQVGNVQSVNQKGGVTAGYVESVNQGPPE